MLTASKERSKRLHLRKSSVADIANDCAIYRTNAQHCCWQQIVERRRSLLRYSGDPKRYFCTFGEKEHTSKRVSIIAPDNAISKAQCATFTSLLRLSATNPLWYTKKTHEIVSLVNLHKGFCVLSHALLCNRTPAGWHCIKKVIKKTRYCESFLCFRKFISCKRQSTRQSLNTFQVRES